MQHCTLIHPWDCSEGEQPRRFKTLFCMCFLPILDQCSLSRSCRRICFSMPGWTAILLGTMNYDLVHMLVLFYICAYIMILALALLQYLQTTPFPLILVTSNTYFNKETKVICLYKVIFFQSGQRSMWRSQHIWYNWGPHACMKLANSELRTSPSPIISRTSDPWVEMINFTFYTSRKHVVCNTQGMTKAKEVYLLKKHYLLVSFFLFKIG